MSNKVLKNGLFLLIFIPCFFMINTKVIAATNTISGSQAGPLNVSTGDTVNVTGTGTLAGAGSNDGLSGDSANNVTVTIANGGEISSNGGSVGSGNAGKAIDLGTGANITVASGGELYDAGNNPAGDDEHASGIYTGANATINISGTVLTDDIPNGGYNHFSEAIDTGANSNITVNSGGLVKANNFGGSAIFLGANSTVSNSGTIDSASMGQADLGAIRASASNITINNNGTIEASANEAVVMGTGGNSTGNVLNLYGNSVITGNLRNDGAAGGALVNFGYTGSAADASADVTMTGNIGSAGNAWNGHVYGGSSTVTGNVAFNNLQLESGSTLNINGTYTQGSGSSLDEAVSSATSYGKIVTNATAVVSSGSSLNVNVDGYVPNNSAITVINTGGNGIGSLPGSISSSSPLVTFTEAATGGNLVLTSSTKSLSTDATSPNAKTVGAILDNVSNPSSSSFSGTFNGLYSSSSTSQVNNSLNSMGSNFENPIPQVTKSVMDQFVLKTLSHGSDNPGTTGVSTGSDMLKSLSVWAEGFGGELHQDAQDLSNGYNASVGGFIVGIEKEISDLWKIGFSQGFSEEVINGKDYSNNSDANSYQSSLYAKFDNAPYYVDTAFSYGYNRYDDSRLIEDGGTDLTAVSRVDGQQYSTYIESGYELQQGNLQITPLASFEYMRLDLPSYTENGAGALDLNVDSQNYNFAQTGFGFKLDYPIPLQTVNLLPEFHFKWLHDWVGDPIESTASFAGGGASFNTVGFTPDRNTYEFGAKLTIFTKGNVTVSLNYDFDLRKDFDANLGYVNVKYSF